LAVAAPAASALEPAGGDLVCEAPEDELAPSRLLRAISLDLRGQLPAAHEYAALPEGDDPDAALSAIDAMVEAWLASEAFAERFVRLHQELLWNNLDDLTLVGVRGRIRLAQGAWWRGGTQASFYRGSNVGCLNAPAEYDEDGAVVQTLQPDGTRREGWVWIAPYWAPDTEIRVCALDAQDALVSPSGTLCASTAGLNDLHCGCGPALRNCLPTGNVYPRMITDAMAADIAHRVRDLIARDASYLELFTSRTVWVNGPLAHYWKHLRAFPRMVVNPPPLSIDRLPELAFTDTETWIPVEMGPEHAGVLTSPAFLMRFQTNRARADRFYNAFLCQPFNSPAGGIPVADESAQIEPDLQVRKGCDYCHALLEPAAAYWGRWGERGASWLDPYQHPAFDAECQLCATTGLPCSQRCRQFYTTTAYDPREADYLGWLQAYHFRRPEHRDFVEDGPRLLVYQTVVDGRFPRCVARTAVERLLGRPPHPEEEPWLDELAHAFVASGYRYREVLKAIVTHPTYRRVR